MQLLAIQAADEARHIEVFTRRALLRRDRARALDRRRPGVARDAARRARLRARVLPALGARRGQLPVACSGSCAITRPIALHARGRAARRAGRGAPRRVRARAPRSATSADDPTLRDRLAAAIERRHAALAHTAGLNEEVFDALVLLAAGVLGARRRLRRGHARGRSRSQRDMDDGRRTRLARLGFDRTRRPQALSALHTRNFSSAAALRRRGCSVNSRVAPRAQAARLLVSSRDAFEALDAATRCFGVRCSTRRSKASASESEWRAGTRPRSGWTR